jgi:signal transduction histidine kinase
MAAQMVTPTDQSQRAPERVPFDLRELYTFKELREIGDRYRIAILDSALSEIYAHPSAENWCRIFQHGGQTKENCPHCPLNRRVQPSPDARLVWMPCSNGIKRPIVPVLYNQQAIGWITGRPHISTSILPLIDKLGDTTLRNRAELLKLPVKPEELAHSLSQAQEVFEGSQHRRREAINEAALRGIERAKDEQTVYHFLFEAIRNLYGPLKAVHIYKQTKDLMGECYRLVYAEGFEQRKEHSRLNRWKTHLGVAIEQDRAHYVPRLGRDDPNFVTPPGTTRPMSVFTIPLRIGADRLPAALQMQSDRQDFFHEEADRKAVKHLASLAALVTAETALRKEITSANYRAESANSWNRFIAGILLDNTWSRNDILRKFQEVYNCFVTQLLATAGPECVGASVRLVNRLTNVLGFVAADGPGFKNDRAQMLYPPYLRGAAHKALADGFLYYEDVAKYRDYYKLIPDTRSLWIKRFEVHGEFGGVVSLDWKVVDGCSPELDEQLRALIGQFERVLEVLADRQDVMVAGLHAPVANNADLDQAARSLVSDLKRLFGARACSLFLDRHNEEKLRLKATTDPGDGQELYEFGEGITGWVAAHKKTVRIRDVRDQEELDGIQRVHGIAQPLQHDWTRYKEGIDREAATKLSFLAAPMVARDRVLGVIRFTVKNDESQEFTHQDETFLQNIADRLARSLDTRWLADDTDDRVRRMEQEAEFQGRLRRASGLTEVCQMLSDQFMHRTQAQGAALLVSDHEEQLDAIVASGLLKLLLMLPQSLILPQADTSSPCIWSAPEWGALSAALKTQLPDMAYEVIQAGRAIAIPMGGAKAVLVVVWQSPKHMREASGPQVADVIESVEAALREARVQKRQADTNEELQRLQELATACASARGLKEVSDKILKVALSEVGMTRGTIRLRRGNDEWVLKAPAGASEAETPPVITTNYGLSRCLDSKEPFIIVSSDPEWQAYLGSLENEVRSNYLSQFTQLVVVPLRKVSDCLGAIVLESTSPYPVPERHMEFLKTLGRYAAVAIHSVQVNETEMEIQSNEMLGAMVRGFAHVMRNKVNNAVNGVALLEAGVLSEEESTKRFSNIKTDLKRISDVCNNLMRLSGKAESDRTGVSLNHSFDEVWTDMPDQLKSYVKLEQRLDPAQPVVVGNPAQLQVALRMLIQNALEAMPDRGGQLVYRTRLRRGWASVIIADNGVGMDQTTKARCREPFFTTKTKGTGLGLSVVLTIARQHHADLSVVSKPGKGTIWKLRFPIAEE